MDPTSTQPQKPTRDTALTRLELALVFVAVALGIGVRFYPRSALWLDEALSVNIAALDIADIPGALRQDGHPPLYYFLLHFWMNIFGSSDTAVRALSAVTSILTIPVVAIIATKKRSLSAGLLTVGFISVLPYMARYATEARMYALVTLLVAGGWLFLLRLTSRAPKLLDAVGLTICSTALLYTHYWGFWIIGTTGALLLWLLWRPPNDLTYQGAKYGVGALLLSGVLFLPWVPSFLEQLAHTGTPWGTRQRPTASIGITLVDLAGGDLVSESIFSAIVLVILLVVALTAAPKSRSVMVIKLSTRPGIRLEMAVAGLALAVGLIITFATDGAYASRYAAFIVPVLAVAGGYGIAAFPAGLARPLALLTTVVVLGATSVIGVGEHRTQSRHAAAIINEAATPEDLILVCPDQLGPAFAREVRSDLTVLAYPTLGAPERVDWRDYATRNSHADPVATAMTLLQRAQHRSIYLAWMGGYTTFEDHCETLRAALMESRPIEPLLVPATEEYFEPMAVDRFLAP